MRLHEPTFGAEEINAATEVMLSTKVTMGPKVKAFEREFAGAFGFPRCNEQFRFLGQSSGRGSAQQCRNARRITPWR